MRTRLVVALVAAGLLAGQALPAWAQIDTGGIDPLEDLTDPVTETVEDTVDTVNDTTEAVTETVEETVSSPTGSTGSGSSGGGSTGGTTSALSGAGGVSTNGGSTTSGGVGGGETTGAANAGSGRTTAAPGTVSRRGSGSDTARDRGKSEGLDPSILSLVSPLVVSKTNDADGDGTFSDEEAAPRPASTVGFRVEITNTGGAELTITDVRDAFENGFGKFGIPVCEDLFGARIPAGASVSCSFTLEEYAPEQGRKVNTLRVTAVETTDPSTRVSGADTSTVTLSEAAVLGIIINPLATTGAAIVGLLRLALALLAAGAVLFAAGRHREDAMLDGSPISE